MPKPRSTKSPDPVSILSSADESPSWVYSEIAPAKINLALHVTGQTGNGYHTLESLVTFADRGDVIHVRPGDFDTFSVSGRFAKELASASENDNLVIKARDGLRTIYRDAGVEAPTVHIHLEKNLPIASGIGGGSADAAATIRALTRLWGGDIALETVAALCLSLGADVPMCLDGRPLVARGIGEDISLVGNMPSFDAILVNPLIAVSTPEVFRRLTSKSNPPLPPLPTSRNKDEWDAFLARLRNDLEPPAKAAAHEIEDVSKALNASGAKLARMSGSGATCFAIYEDCNAAAAALKLLETNHPGWYFLSVRTVTGEES